MAKKKTKKINYIYSVGKRKKSSARIRLFKGKGENTVNQIKAEDYFTGVLDGYKLKKPFGILDIGEKYFFSAKVVGGGKSGQLDAVVYGLAKAIKKIKPDEYKKPLKDAGLLTRDARIKERRKAGTGGKARRQKQSPKR